MTQTPNCSFILSVERGKLEAQAIFLVESLRRFGGAYADCPVYAVSPRPARQMGRDTRRALAALGAETIIEDLIWRHETYGTVARIAVSAWAERNLTSEILVALDDDLFFAGEPDFSLPESDFMARPVDVKEMCTTGTDDPYDPYWRAIAALTDVDYDKIDWVETSIEHIRVKASYNGGMIAVRRSAGLFQATESVFRAIQENDLSPYQPGQKEIFSSIGLAGAEASRWWGSSQAAFSLATTRKQARGMIALPTYNVPIHLAGYARYVGEQVTLKDAVLVHYHWLLEQESIKQNPLLDEDWDTLRPDVLSWLKSKTPLRKPSPYWM